MKLNTYFLILTFLLLTSSAVVFGQTTDNTSIYQKTLGGRGSLSISGSPDGNQLENAQHRQSLILSPYLLTQKKDANRQKVIGLQLQVENESQRNNNSFTTTKRITSLLSVGMTFGERRRIYTANKFFGAAEYGIGPRITLNNIRNFENNTRINSNTSFSVGAQAYLDVIVGYQITDRLNLLCTLFSWDTNANVRLRQDNFSPRYFFNSEAAPRLAIGVEWKF